MSSDTDHPRQRTVAELLAQHGDSGATGRRRRRRAADEAEESGGYAAAVSPRAGPAHGGRPAPAVAPAPVVLHDPAPPGRPLRPVGEPAVDRAVLREPARPLRPVAEPEWDRPLAARRSPEVAGERPVRPVGEPPVDRAVLREPVPPLRPVTESAPDLPPIARRGAETPAVAFAPRPVLDPIRDRTTDPMPRLRVPPRDEPDPALTGPIAWHRGGPAPDLPGGGASGDDRAGAERDDGPSTMVGLPPAGAEDWHHSRVARQRDPASRPAPFELDDYPAGLAPPDRRGSDEPVDMIDGGDLLGGDALSPDPAGRATAGRELPGRDTQDRPDLDRAAPGADAEADRRVTRPAPAAAPGQAWAAVVAQWIVGAIGGAALWVGFRFLWRSLPVVALAAAVLVTVGLVVVVRALLRNSDLRTTVFAVVVGLLLTASPAILVLLGR